MSAVCQKVFQKFPDFVQRCKDEAFEALSDPMYSGKMKVQFRKNGSVFRSLWAVLVYVNVSVFLSGFAEAAEILSAKKRQSTSFLSLNQGESHVCVSVYCVY